MSVNDWASTETFTFAFWTTNSAFVTNNHPTYIFSKIKYDQKISLDIVQKKKQKQNEKSKTQQFKYT